MWYFHAASCDDAGNWSLPNHYLMIKDTIPPAICSVSPAGNTISGAHNIEFISENGRIVVDNFDDGKDPNAFGANYWTLAKDAAISTGYSSKIGLENTSCYEVYYSGVRYGTYCGLVMYLADIDISDAGTLSFYIKGAKGDEAILKKGLLRFTRNDNYCVCIK